MATVTKAVLLNQLMANNEQLSAAQAIRFVESFIDVISDTLSSGEEVKLSGFGKFSLLQKKARSGRNPKTGEPLTINSRKVVKFKASAILRAKMNNSLVPQDD